MSRDVSFDELARQMLIACAEERFTFAADVNWLVRRKLKLRVPGDWPKLAAQEIANRGLGVVSKHGDDLRPEYRLELNEKGLVAGIKAYDQMLAENRKKEIALKQPPLSASAWGAILTGVGVMVAIIIAVYD